MKIECKELLGILDRLSPIAKAIKIREHIPALLLHDNQLIAQSEDCYMSIMLDHDFDNIVIPFDKTYELLSRFSPNKKISLTQEDNKIKVITRIGRKKTSATIAALAEVGDEINYIDPVDSKWLPLPHDFIDAINLCKFSLPRESLNPVLMNYGINKGVVITSDDFRISHYTLDHAFDQALVISAASGDIIVANQFDEYIPKKKYIDFRKDEIWTRVTLATIDYPIISEKMFNYNNFFSVKKDTLIKALERAAIFAEGESELDYVVNLHIGYESKPKFTIYAKNDFGKINEAGLLEASNIEKDLPINPIYLLQILKNINEKTIQIGVDEFDRLIFNEGPYSHILATYNE
jgi:hypothetical protein